MLPIKNTDRHKIDSLIQLTIIISIFSDIDFFKCMQSHVSKPILEFSYTYLHQTYSHKISSIMLVWLKKSNSTCKYIKANNYKNPLHPWPDFQIDGPFTKARRLTTSSSILHSNLTCTLFPLSSYQFIQI